MFKKRFIVLGIIIALALLLAIGAFAGSLGWDGSLEFTYSNDGFGLAPELTFSMAQNSWSGKISTEFDGTHESLLTYTTEDLIVTLSNVIENDVYDLSLDGLPSHPGVKIEFPNTEFSPYIMVNSAAADIINLGVGLSKDFGTYTLSNICNFDAESGLGVLAFKVEAPISVDSTEINVIGQVGIGIQSGFAYYFKVVSPYLVASFDSDEVLTLTHDRVINGGDLSLEAVLAAAETPKFSVDYSYPIEEAVSFSVAVTVQPGAVMDYSAGVIYTF